MIPQGFYKNGVFVSEMEDEISNDSNPFYHLACSLLEKEGINEGIIEIKPTSANLDFDSFRVKTEKDTYFINVSYDEESFLLKGESYFLENNTHPMLPIYVGSGLHRLGENLYYLIYKDNVGMPLHDVGVSFAYLGRWNMLGCLKVLNSFKINRSFVDYANFIFKHFDLNDAIPEVTSSHIYPIHKQEDINKVTEPIKEYFYSSLDLSIVNKDSFCHGDLNFNNISTNGFLFKFHNFNSSFMGHPFLDICFMSLNLCFDNYMLNNYMKSFCSVNDLDYEKSKPTFRYCLDIASCVFLYKKFNEFLVEQCVYENKREEKIISTLRCFDNAQWCFKRLPFYESIKKEFTKIYESPSKII